MQTSRAQIIPSVPEIKTTEILIKYIHNELDQNRCDAVKSAIENCKACAEMYNDLRDAFDLNKNEEFESNNTELLQRVDARTKQQVKQYYPRPKMDAILPRKSFLTAVSDDACDCCGG